MFSNNFLCDAMYAFIHYFLNICIQCLDIFSHLLPFDFDIILF
jgi:hypothetical protein